MQRLRTNIPHSKTYLITYRVKQKLKRHHNRQTPAQSLLCMAPNVIKIDLTELATNLKTTILTN